MQQNLVPRFQFDAVLSTVFNDVANHKHTLVNQARNFHQIIGGGGQNLSFTILLFLRLSEFLG